MAHETSTTAKRLVTLDEAGTEYLGGISRSGVKRLIAAGEITRVLIGRRAFVSVQSINEYIDRRITAGTSGAA